MQVKRSRLGILCVTALLIGSSGFADVWNDRTLLTFSAPVMVPGATLAEGTYEFRIANLASARHVVHITNQATGDVVATVSAVPVQRREASSETVLRFNPTESGSPVALQAWFYPGDRNGHQFIYSDEEARRIAERTKTIVLSGDAPSGEHAAGQLRVIDASGQQSHWAGDEAAVKSWSEWARSRPAQNAGDRSASGPPESTAPVIARADANAWKVALDALEDDPTRYVGQRVSVDAEVERVIGPRLFTIDEPNWVDLDGEVMVFMPSTLAAMVREGDRLTVTGTLSPFATLDIDRDGPEWFGWFGDDADVRLALGTRMVLVADRLVGGDDDFAMIIRSDASAHAGAVGFTGSSASTERSPISRMQTLSGGDDELVGRPVVLENVTVALKAAHDGFYVGGDTGDKVYVLPVRTAALKQGDQVRIEGVVLQMPRGREDPAWPASVNDEIYVYALNVR
jgi:hypothetical protein